MLEVGSADHSASSLRPRPPRRTAAAEVWAHFGDTRGLIAPQLTHQPTRVAGVGLPGHRRQPTRARYGRDHEVVRADRRSPLLELRSDQAVVLGRDIVEPETGQRCELGGEPIKIGYGLRTFASSIQELGLHHRAQHQVPRGPGTDSRCQPRGDRPVR
jgi:hypothetical protein